MKNQSQAEMECQSESSKRSREENEDDEVLSKSQRKAWSLRNQPHPSKPKPTLSSDDEQEHPQCTTGDRNGEEKLIKSLKEQIGNIFSQLDDPENDAAKRAIYKSIYQVSEAFKTLRNENQVLKSKISNITRIEEKLNRLTATVDATATDISGIKTQIQSTKLHKLSYAESVKVTCNAIPQKTIKPPRNIITVYPEENSNITNSDETKQRIQSSITPLDEKLQIRNVRKIRENGVLIETHTKENLISVMNNINSVKVGLKAELPAKKKPRMIIHGLPNNETEEYIIAAIQGQNLNSLNNSKPSEHIKLLFKKGDKSHEYASWVVEVSPVARDIFKKEGRVFMDWYSYHIQDFTAVSRCYKCQSFGHVSKHCRASVDTCGHCAQDGHSFKNCPSISQKPSCINCKRFGKHHDHSSRAKECPAFQYATQNYLSKIDYGK